MEAARKIYTPATNPRTSQQIFPGLEPGSELGWAGKAGPQPNLVSISYWRYVVFKDPNWDYKTFNFDSDVALGDRIGKDIVNAKDPNLKTFFGRGGKLPIAALEQWVEKGKAPDQIIASRIGDGKTERTRPLCPLPTSGDVQGNRKHGQCRELLMLGPEIAGASGLIK